MSDDSLNLILSSHGRTWDHLDVWLGTKPRSQEDREMDQHDVAVNEHVFMSGNVSYQKNIVHTKKSGCCCCCCCFRKGPKLFRWLMVSKSIAQGNCSVRPTLQTKEFLVFSVTTLCRCPKPTFVSKTAAYARLILALPDKE